MRVRIKWNGIGNEKVANKIVIPRNYRFQLNSHYEIEKAVVR